MHPIKCGILHENNMWQNIKQRI